MYDSVLMALCCDRWPCQRASPSAAAAQRRASPDRRIRERPTHLDAEELLDADADGGAAAPQADEVLREPKRPRKGSALRTERRSTEHGSRRTLRSDEIRWSGAHRWSVAVVPDCPGQFEAVHIQAVRIEENFFLRHGGRSKPALGEHGSSRRQVGFQSSKSQNNQAATGGEILVVLHTFSRT